jgi:hypothetical protein
MGDEDDLAARRWIFEMLDDLADDAIANVAMEFRKVVGRVERSQLIIDRLVDQEFGRLDEKDATALSGKFIGAVDELMRLTCPRESAKRIEMQNIPQSKKSKIRKRINRLRID